MNNIFKPILIIILFSLFCCCSSKDVSYYENGSVREERFYKWNNKSNPFIIKSYYNSGKVKEILKYNKSGFLDSSVKIETTGDSIVDKFTNDEKKLFRRIYTEKNEIIKQHYKEGKMTGITYYYKDKVLLKRQLVEEGQILACDITEIISNDKVVKILPEGDISGQDIPSVYKNYKFATTQYINLPEEGYTPVGVYLSNDSLSYPDTSAGSFVYMNLPDTANCSEEINGKIFGSFEGKDSVYLKIYLFNLDETPKEGVFNKMMKSSHGDFVVDFKLTIDEPGYHFLCGYAYLMKDDSTQIQNYIIYDDVCVLTKH